MALWAAQTFIFAAFGVIGYLKLTTPVADLSDKMQIHWAVEFPEWFVRTMGVIDLAGGIGILLPALTGILPGLMVPAAAGCTLLQICAIMFHASRGEFSVLPLNFILLPVAAFVLWGRTRRAPIGR